MTVQPAMPLTRGGFLERFGRRALFGMVHLEPLPGSPLYGGSLAHVRDRALGDARAIIEGGASGVVFENFGDRPFSKRAAVEAIASMAAVIGSVAGKIDVPFGVNVLRNDGEAAIAIAAATGASFIRVNVFSGAMLTDQGLIEGEAAAVVRARCRLAPTVAIFADFMVKHAVPLAALDAVQHARDLRMRALADALIVTGSETGKPADLDRMAMLRDATAAPIIAGSGVTAESAASYAQHCDAMIVGTAIKQGGEIRNPVDRDRVAALVEALARA
jgi:uncharacterized protein